MGLIPPDRKGLLMLGWVSHHKLVRKGVSQTQLEGGHREAGSSHTWVQKHIGWWIRCGYSSLASLLVLLKWAGGEEVV